MLSGTGFSPNKALKFAQKTRRTRQKAPSLLAKTLGAQMEASEKKWRGGARIDLMNATWPFARLTVTQKELVLRVSFLGTYVFKPEDVELVEAYGVIPFVGKGVRIHHKVTGYPQKIIFWCLCFNPKEIENSIRTSGYGT